MLKTRQMMSWLCHMCYLAGILVLMGLRPTIDSGRHPTLLAAFDLLFLVE
jgi:hypothetical protein